MVTRATQSEIPKVASSSQTGEVNHQICKPGFPGKSQNIHFNRLKPNPGEFLPKRSERIVRKTLPRYEKALPRN